MTTMASLITSLTVVYSILYSGADQRKHQSSASLAFVWGITGEFPAQRASYAENVSIWWRHHDISKPSRVGPLYILDPYLVNIVFADPLHLRSEKELQKCERNFGQDFSISI